MSDERRPQRPFDAIRHALNDISPEDINNAPVSDEGSVHPDTQRRQRTGVPEVVLAGSKTFEQILASVTALAAAGGRAVASRCSNELLAALPEEVERHGNFRCEVHAEAAAAVVIAVDHPEASVAPSGGRIGIVSAGTSDARVAAEAGLIASEMGCVVTQVRDVGVAGLHRLVRPLEAMIADETQVIVVVAGMDGALPSVVAGLVNVPVIGLPSSIGYGLGGGGEAALLSMLQTCVPGLVVVNIDNGIGAGAAAARIANRLAAAARSIPPASD